MENTVASTRRAGEGRESARWRAVLDRFLKGAPTAVMRLIRKASPTVVFEDVIIVGRRTGKERRLLLGVFDVGGIRYVGHPNGTAQWVRNLEEAGTCVVVWRDGTRVRYTATELAAGNERDAVIRRTSDQPAPAGLIYRGAQHHIQAVGRYFRLEPIEAAERAD